ncbi:MAG: tetratricopeptide repeat protein [Pirellulaceae bacterium]|nr:tetratricopeptide repeat protein [Pirellulaceae bacterium]
MRCKRRWALLCLMLSAAATAGCASLPGLTRLMPGGTAKSNQTLDAQLSMARLSERHGDAHTAERIYQAVLTKQPQNQLALHRLGVLAAKTGENEQAAKHFDAAAQLGPPSAELLNDIGFNLFVMGRLQEAEAAFRQAIAADPQNRSARNNLGLVLGETRRYDESLAEFRRGGKGEAEAQANLAYAQTQAGDVTGAQSSYHRALTLDKELKPAAEALVQLARQPQTNLEGGSASEIKTLPELARAGRTSNFFESVIERDRAAGRANADHPSGESTGAVRQIAYVRDAAAAGQRDSYSLSARKPDPSGAQSASMHTLTNRPADGDQSVSSPAVPEQRVAVGAGASSMLSRVFRFPTRVESEPTAEIHRRTTTDVPAPNSAARSASRLSARLSSPAKLADAVAPPAARTNRWRRATLHRSALNASLVAPFEALATQAADDPQAQPSAAQMPPSGEPAPGSVAVLAAPTLFLSSIPGTAAPNPWQTPTWTPDFGAAMPAGGAAPAASSEGTIVPARPLANLAP